MRVLTIHLTASCACGDATDRSDGKGRCNSVPRRRPRRLGNRNRGPIRNRGRPRYIHPSKMAIPQKQWVRNIRGPTSGYANSGPGNNSGRDGRPYRPAPELRT